MAGKTYIDKLEQKIRLGGARVVAEELKDLLDINHKLEKRIIQLEKVVKRNGGTLGSVGGPG